MRRVLFLPLVSALTFACGGAGAPGGTAGSCFAASDDSEVPSFSQAESRSGLRIVAADDETAAPAAFDDCAAGKLVRGEFVDGDGAHIWLATDGQYGSRNLIPKDIFSLVNDSTLSFQKQFGLSGSFTSLVLSNGDQPILAVQSSAELTGDVGGLQVEHAGGTALGSFGSCGTETPQALRFADDDGDHNAANGESVELIVGGVEFLATNIFTVAYGETSCEDGPPSGEIRTTWVAADNSL